MATKNIAQKQVFGKGNAEKLRDKIAPNKQVSAAFVNVDMLTGLQHTELEKLLGMPVFDRYGVVLQIFKDHAKTRVARLQVALAEIPHIRWTFLQIKVKTNNNNKRFKASFKYLSDPG